MLHSGYNKKPRIRLQEHVRFGAVKNKRNYYRILHVQPDAPQAIIKSSYRTLMHRLKQHPDVGGDHGNAALINEAYAAISSPRKRAEYDSTLLHTSAASTVKGQKRDVAPMQGSPRKSETEQRSMGQALCAFCGTAHRFGRNPHQDATCGECASPIKCIEKLRLEKSCRRMVHRVTKHIRIAFYTVWPQKKGYDGVVKDISLRGMQFFTHNPPETGQHIKVECETCTAVAHVKNCEKVSAKLGTGWVVGVEFETILFTETRGSFVSLKI